jgi:hypothetical protein
MRVTDLLRDMNVTSRRLAARGPILSPDQIAWTTLKTLPRRDLAEYLTAALPPIGDRPVWHTCAAVALQMAMICHMIYQRPYFNWTPWDLDNYCPDLGLQVAGGTSILAGEGRKEPAPPGWKGLQPGDIFVPNGTFFHGLVLAENPAPERVARTLINNVAQKLPALVIAPLPHLAPFKQAWRQSPSLMFDDILLDLGMDKIGACYMSCTTDRMLTRV